MTENINRLDVLTPAEKLLGLSLFWREVSYHFAFFDQVPQLNFDEAYQQFIPQVLETASTYEYYRTLQRFCALLQDGHTNVYLPPGLELAYVDSPAIRVIELRQEAIITQVDKKFAEMIPLGSRILAVDGISTPAYLKSEVMPIIASSTEHVRWAEAVAKMLHGPINTELSLTLQTPSGDQKQCSVIRNERVGGGEMLSLKLPSSQNKRIEYKSLESGIGYVALNDFSHQDVVVQFESYLPHLAKAKGLILDLRFNGGGDSSIGGAILAYLSNQPLVGSRWKTRQHISAYKAWGTMLSEYQDYADDNAWLTGEHGLIEPKADALTKCPIFVLIGRGTASAAEDFLVYAQALDTMTTIGEYTYGSTGQPLFRNLPGGGCFRVCTKRDTYADGRDFVGTGIKPDILVSPTYQHLIDGVDYVLETAVELMTRNLQNEDSPLNSTDC